MLLREVGKAVSNVQSNLSAFYGRIKDCRSPEWLQLKMSRGFAIGTLEVLQRSKLDSNGEDHITRLRCSPEVRPYELKALTIACRPPISGPSQPQHVIMVGDYNLAGGQMWSSRCQQSAGLRLSLEQRALAVAVGQICMDSMASSVQARCVSVPRGWVGHPSIWSWLKKGTLRDGLARRVV